MLLNSDKLYKQKIRKGGGSIIIFSVYPQACPVPPSTTTSSCYRLSGIAAAGIDHNCCIAAYDDGLMWVALLAVYDNSLVRSMRDDHLLDGTDDYRVDVVFRAAVHSRHTRPLVGRNNRRNGSFDALAAALECCSSWERPLVSCHQAGHPSTIGWDHPSDSYVRHRPIDSADVRASRAASDQAETY